jgi:NhaP-type Na+/H+ or K+/H+ antiporter
VYVELAVLAIFAFFYSTIAGAVEKTPITGPIVFTAFGLIAGPLGMGWLEPDINNDELKYLADLTLAFILFLDAANADLGVLRRSFRIPGRMLLLGLPGVIGLGFVVGVLLFDGLTWIEVAILATTLAATDAALGKAVIGNKAVPAQVREGLNVESGLNDGLCVPILFLFIALALGSTGEGGAGPLAVRLVVQEVGIGLLVGVGITAVGVWLIRVGQQHGWITEVWAQLPVVTLSVACFAVAQSLHGSGYIAAFVGGMLFGSLAKESTHKLVLAAEGTAELFALLIWIEFGTAVIGWAWDYVTWQVLLYAVLSLTLIRMLPIFLSLSGTGERTESKLFLGWFGPRGLASVVFAIIVVNNELPGARLIAVVVTCTVFFSLLAHGLTANPLAAEFARRMQRLGKDV